MYCLYLRNNYILFWEKQSFARFHILNLLAVLEINWLKTELHLNLMCIFFYNMHILIVMHGGGGGAQKCLFIVCLEGIIGQNK